MLGAVHSGKPFGKQVVAHLAMSVSQRGFGVGGAGTGGSAGARSPAARRAAVGRPGPWGLAGRVRAGPTAGRGLGTGTFDGLRH